MEKRRLWSRNELIVVFNLYLKLPFGKMHSRTLEVIHLARLLGRTPNSIAMRLSNFAACDPYHQQRGIKGMVGGLNQCQPIWDEFSNSREILIFESERILAGIENHTIENKFDDLLLDITDLKGEDKIREVKTRVNQNVFRQIVLGNYSGTCAITNIDIPELLFASHIIPWARNEAERLNPENGICFSALYDKAFDSGLIAVNERYEILISSFLKGKRGSNYYERYFSHLTGRKLNLPQKYLPRREFLQYHIDEVFEKIK